MENCAYFCHWFVQDWIIPIDAVDEYAASVHSLFNEFVCEHNWDYGDVYSMPLGLRSYHRDLINARVAFRNQQNNPD